MVEVMKEVKLHEALSEAAQSLKNEWNIGRMLETTE